MLSRLPFCLKKVYNISMDIGSVSHTPPGGSTPESTRPLSPVQLVLQKHEASKVNPNVETNADGETESFFDSEIYLKAKVAQLEGQLDFFSKMPDYIASGAMDSIEAEIIEFYNKIKEKSDAQTAKLDEQEAKLEEQALQKRLEKSVLTTEQMLERAAARARGEDVPDFNPDDPFDSPPKEKFDPDVLSVEELLKRAAEAAGSVDISV